MRQRFVFVVSSPALILYALSDVVAEFEPRLGDSFVFLVFSSSSGGAEPLPPVALGGDIPVVLLLQTLLGAKAESVGLDEVVEGLKRAGFEVRVVKYDLGRVDFTHILLSTYRAIKEAVVRGDEVVVNLTCCDNVTGIAAFLAVMFSAWKWPDKVRLAGVRSRLLPLQRFRICIPPRTIRLKETARKIISYLEERESARFPELARALGVSKANISRAVKELESLGIVKTYLDGRVKCVVKGPLFELGHLLV